MKKILSIITLLFLLSGCSNPLPEDRLNYVGEWQSKEVNLLILADGTVAYKRLQNGGSTSINAPLQSFSGDNFIVGISFMTTTFTVSKPPHQIAGKWKMTVDGIELTKTRE
ncbi:MAG: hypothetical protein COA90_00635 [Gammaproteobacteria bacterium]|nr:MAG: hypothetical protein COA90_00635 [Gammaproteobacteria bacterium]